MTITEFLLARIAEDETVARESTPGPWSSAPAGYCCQRACVDPVVHNYSTLYWRDGDHIARHDPARVLAECAAKRVIVALYDDLLRGEVDHRDASGLGASLMHSDVIRALAAVYADHPDYRSEWARG